MDLRLLSFVAVDNKKLGLRFYPPMQSKGYLYGEKKGRLNVEEVISYYCLNGFDTDLLSRMIVELAGIDPINEDLSASEMERLGHIKGIMSVVHQHICIGLSQKN